MPRRAGRGGGARPAQAQTERYEIEMDEKMANSVSDRQVQITSAEGEKEVAVTEAKGAIDVAAYDARTEKNNVVARARIACERDTKAAELRCLEQRKESGARKETAGRPVPGATPKATYAFCAAAARAAARTTRKNNFIAGLFCLARPFRFCQKSENHAFASDLRRVCGHVLEE